MPFASESVSYFKKFFTKKTFINYRIIMLKVNYINVKIFFRKIKNIRIE